MRGSEDRSDYLYFEPESQHLASVEKASSEPQQSDDTENSLDIKELANYPYRELAEIEGVGEYVSVVARLDHI